MLNKNIYALATPFGKSGVAIIRISGDKCKEVAEMLGVSKKLSHKLALYSEIFHPLTKHKLDNCLLLYFEYPYSYNGENILELHIHGSRAVINSVLDALSKIEFLRLAEPGEFTKIAFINGKMDLTQVEALADLIDAETYKQQEQALKQMSGRLRDMYEGWREQIIHSMAFLEALIDFPDEDIPQEILNNVDNSVKKLVDEIEKHIADNNKGEIIRSGIKVAITGKPNVGKSSLLNYLAKREIAIVSNIPGTTRDVLEVNLDIGGFPFILYDTAGIRESNDIVENIGIDKAKKTVDIADIIIEMHDITDFNFKEINYKNNQIIVLNKIDCLKQNNLQDNDQIIGISIVENKNIDTLTHKLLDFAQNNYNTNEDVVITRQRYRENCDIALTSLKLFSINKPFELAAEDLRVAAFAIGRITGRIDVEELLGAIFSSFCIGK